MPPHLDFSVLEGEIRSLYGTQRKWHPTTNRKLMHARFSPFAMGREAGDFSLVAFVPCQRKNIYQHTLLEAVACGSYGIRGAGQHAVL